MVLKLENGKFSKFQRFNSYELVSDIKKASIFDNFEEMNFWRGTISRIWKMPVQPFYL
jgi:hypothetical protein